MAGQPNTRFPWDTFLREFTIEHARVVATLSHNGGAVVEQLPMLHCAEGRLYTFQFVDKAELHAFEYVFTFHQSDEGDPMAASSVEARIVIEGTHASGHPLEIRGDGWIGYDSDGNLEGRFDDPPVILTNEWNDATTEDVVPEDSPVFKPITRFPMPEQFARALVRFPPENDD